MNIVFLFLLSFHYLDPKQRFFYNKQNRKYPNFPNTIVVISHFYYLFAFLMEETHEVIPQANDERKTVFFPIST